MSDYAGDNAELADALEEFRKMRERLRKPLTGHALKLTLRDLDKLAGANERLKIAIVEQSAQRGWQGVFALHEQARASPQDQREAIGFMELESERNKRAFAERIERENRERAEREKQERVA